MKVFSNQLVLGFHTFTVLTLKSEKNLALNPASKQAYTFHTSCAAFQSEFADLKSVNFQNFRTWRAAGLG